MKILKKTLNRYTFQYIMNYFILSWASCTYCLKAPLLSLWKDSAQTGFLCVLSRFYIQLYNIRYSSSLSFSYQLASSFPISFYPTTFILSNIHKYLSLTITDLINNAKNLQFSESILQLVFDDTIHLTTHKLILVEKVISTKIFSTNTIKVTLRKL